MWKPNMRHFHSGSILANMVVAYSNNYDQSMDQQTPFSNHYDGLQVRVNEFCGTELVENISLGMLEVRAKNVYLGQNII